jgi:pyruvate/2-oxoglutarate dehydrogenase complex dihydrolipoamide dehydrogenase (E3) component
VGAGRVPNVTGLGLEAASVEYDEVDGVKVDDRMRTTNGRIFAAGDVASRFKFTHISDATARIVIRNALFFGHDRMSALTVPWCTYTDPEVGHVGLYEREARERGIAVTTFVQELRDVDGPWWMARSQVSSRFTSAEVGTRSLARPSLPGTRARYSPN